MTDTEILQIENIFNKAILPLQDDMRHNTEDLREVRQTVYGSDERGGLKKAAADIELRMASMETFRTQVKTVGYTLLPLSQATITGLMMWIRSLFK
jgi:hypothetical protein